MQLVIGLIVLCGGVFGGFLLHGGGMGLIWQPTELIIIFGAAAGALVMANPFHVLAEMRRQILRTLRGRNTTEAFQRQLLLLLYSLLETVRSGGLKALDQHVEDPKESALFQRYPLILERSRLLIFIVDNFRLMAMGRITPHELEAMLDLELEAIEDDLMQPSRSLGKLGDAMPGFGILAAVLGLVTAMADMSGTVAEIGMKVAAAMVGTFIGILASYGLMEPLASAIGHRVKDELAALECVKVVLCAQAAGKPTLLAVDAGRKLIPLDVKPTFFTLETWIEQIKESGGSSGIS